MIAGNKGTEFDLQPDEHSPNTKQAFSLSTRVWITQEDMQECFKVIRLARGSTSSRAKSAFDPVLFFCKDVFEFDRRRPGCGPLGGIATTPAGDEDYPDSWDEPDF